MTGFSGELIHVKHVAQTWPSADITTGNSENDNANEIEIFPAAFFKLGQTKLPVLRGWQIWFHPTGALQGTLGATGESLQVSAQLYNADDDDYDDENFLGEIDGGIKLTTSLNVPHFEQWFISTMLPTDVGVLLRPTITIVTNCDNSSGTTIAADAEKIHVLLFIDWIDVSEQDIEDYLKELWLAEEFD